MSHFALKCRQCGVRIEAADMTLREHCPDALLTTEYTDLQFAESGHGGLWRFNWLPVHHVPGEAAGPVVFRSERLGPALGLENLYIAFNGYWPEKGAEIRTCTFKEFEAEVVLANARENGKSGLVVASAGNTARAFAHLSAHSGFPVIILAPAMCLKDMWYLESSSRVPTLILKDGDYSDAIQMSQRIAAIAGIPCEGGVRSPAKRDGLGIVLLESVAAFGRLPNHYFQAVGSGAGAIAVWEMSERFIQDGRYGDQLPVLHIAQNLPFAPMVRAWARGTRQLAPEDLDPALIPKISTRVLSNRYPAYAVAGGVYDALTATGGIGYGVTNDEVLAAMKCFEETEGIDIVPAAGVAVAALIQASAGKKIPPHDRVLLNITGGGESRIRQEGKARPLEDQIPVSKRMTDQEIEGLLCTVLKRT
jgi:cysteate synthase